MAGHVGKEVAYLQPALAVAGEGERRRQGGPGPPLGRQFVGDLPAGVLLERDLAVEGVEMARAAVGEDVDDRPGAGWKMRRTRRHRRGHHGAGRRRFLLQKACCTQPTEAHAGAGERLAAGERQRVVIRVGHADP